MPASTGTRTSSLFSLDSQATSMSSNDLEFSTEKPASVNRRVLHWQPLKFSTAFTCTVSTRLNFTRFPPYDLKSPLFEKLSVQSANALLNKYNSPNTLSFLAQSDCLLRPVDHIPFPPSLPHELIHILGNREWEYFSITKNTVPTSIGAFCTSFEHHVAVRRIQQRVERYIFGPSGLCIHSIYSVEDVGVSSEEKIPRETLFLHEEVEVICNMFLKWWTQSLVATQIASAHERLRQEWDEAVCNEWEMIKMRKKIDLLA